MDEPGTPGWRADEAHRLLRFGRAGALPSTGFGWLDTRGALDPLRSRPLFLNARMTYVFALAGLGGEEGAAALSASGVSALSTRYADERNGGFFAELGPDDRVSDSAKMNYAHAATLLATSAALVAGLPGAEDAYTRTTAVIERYFWSDAEGAAVETWNEQFTELEKYRGANSNMHSVEAYLAAADAGGETVWRDRALSIAGKIIDENARAHGWRIPEHYGESWRPLPEYNADRRDDQFRPYGFTPGHSFEWARLLVQMAAALAEPPQWLVPAAVSLFDRALADGQDRDGRPGIVYTVDSAGEPVVTSRLHWVMCEAVLAADALFRETGQARFAEAQSRWWSEIERYFVDRRGGSWWHELDADLHPAATLWAGKPDLYHAYQAVVFPSLPLAPTAATALKRRQSALA
jgi:mannose/cellobiose epimerase-like protein (N-acyl-D-glucosamine 2-epimerase family)